MIKIFLRYCFVVFSGAFLAGFGVSAQAQWAVIDAANINQTTLTAIRTLAQLEELKRQAESLGKSMDSNPIQSLQSLGRVVGSVDALGANLTQINGQLQKAFPDYNSGQPFIADYNAASKTNRETIKGAMVAMGQQGEDISNNSMTSITRLSNLSDNVDGGVKAAQVGHQISLQTVASIDALRQLTVAQNQAVNTHMMGQQQEKDMKAEVHRKLYPNTPIRDIVK